ncbi:hypothetical protein [Methanobacterium sp.]|uniref:hypothetical protein n=1 Tax=Methanobacterium sp. TaxID=2164 RepID=UPI003C722370
MYRIFNGIATSNKAKSRPIYQIRKIDEIIQYAKNFEMNKKDYFVESISTGELK